MLLNLCCLFVIENAKIMPNKNATNDIITSAKEVFFTPGIIIAIREKVI